MALLLSRKDFRSPFSMNGRTMYGIPSSVLRHTPSRPSTLGCSIFFIKTHSFKKLSTSSESKASTIHKTNNNIPVYKIIKLCIRAEVIWRTFLSLFYSEFLIISLRYACIILKLFVRLPVCL